MEHALLGFLWYGLFPVWLIAGFADYLCHRKSDIGRTSGFRESLLHLLQSFEVGFPLLAGLFLEINALRPPAHDRIRSDAYGDRAVGRRLCRPAATRVFA